MVRHTVHDLGDDDVDVDGAEERNTAQKHANIPDRIINLIYSQSQDSCARDRIESSTSRQRTIKLYALPYIHPPLFVTSTFRTTHP